MPRLRFPVLFSSILGDLNAGSRYRCGRITAPAVRWIRRFVAAF